MVNPALPPTIALLPPRQSPADPVVISLTLSGFPGNVGALIRWLQSASSTVAKVQVWVSDENFTLSVDINFAEPCYDQGAHIIFTMTITEIALLKITHPHTLSSPVIAAFFRDLSEKQSACSGHPLLFLRRFRTGGTQGMQHLDASVQSEALDEVLLVSGWRNVAAHNEWIAGDLNQALLRQANEENLLSVGLFMHLNVDFHNLREQLIQEEPGRVLLEPVSDQDEHLERPETAQWEARGRTVDEGKDEIWSIIKTKEDSKTLRSFSNTDDTLLFDLPVLSW